MFIRYDRSFLSRYSGQKKRGLKWKYDTKKQTPDGSCQSYPLHKSIKKIPIKFSSYHPLPAKKEIDMHIADPHRSRACWRSQVHKTSLVPTLETIGLDHGEFSTLMEKHHKVTARIRKSPRLQRCESLNLFFKAKWWNHGYFQQEPLIFFRAHASLVLFKSFHKSWILL